MTSRSSAFIRPGFLLAVAVLIVNDHFLKHSFLHGWVTGKLSDFSGLIVAPVVLSECVRLLLSKKRHDKFVHLLSLTSVGFAFTALKLFASVASNYDQVVTWIFSAPCHTAVDPSDLIALAALPLAYWLMRGDEHIDFPSRTSTLANATRRSSFVAAMFACVATSPEDRTARSEGRVFLANATSATVDVRVRWYRGVFDCVRAQRDFETFATSMQDRALFGQGVTFRLRASEMAPLDQEHAWAQTQTPRPASTTRQTTCEVALVSTDGTPEILVLVDTTLPVTSFAGTDARVADTSTTVASLRADPDPRIDPHAVPTVRFAPSTRTTCAIAAPLLTFSDPELVGTNSVTLRTKARNDDGCFDLELTRGVASTPFFVCVPEAFFPFAVGETLSFRSNSNTLEISGASNELTIGLVRNATLRDVSLGLLRFHMTEMSGTCGAPSACGAFDVPAQVTLSYDNAPLVLDSDRSATFASNQRIAVGAALTRIAAPDECGLTLGAQFTYARLRQLP